MAGNPRLGITGGGTFLLATAVALSAIGVAQRAERETSSTLAAYSCPTERGPVRVGSDRDRNLVSTYVHRVGVRYLRGLAKPSSYPRANRIHPYELRTYQLSATITRYRVARNGDIQLKLVDASGRSALSVIPPGSCVPSTSRWRSSIAAARQRVVKVLHPTSSWQSVHRQMTVRGLGYFAVLHGLPGEAPNGFELHPAYAVGFGSTITTPTTVTAPPSTAPSPSPSPSPTPSPSATAKSPVNVELINNFPGAVHLTVNGQAWDLAAGEQVGPVTVTPADSGNDVITVSPTAYPGCGTGNAGGYFSTGSAFDLTVTDAPGTCSPGDGQPNVDGPEFTVTATG